MGIHHIACTKVSKTNNTILQALSSGCTLFGLVAYFAVLRPQVATEGGDHLLPHVNRIDSDSSIDQSLELRDVKKKKEKAAERVKIKLICINASL